MSRPGLGPLSLLQWVLGCILGGVGIVVIQPGHEVDHPPTFNAEIKNEWSYTYSSPLCFPGMDRDITCTLYLFCSLMAQIRSFHHLFRQTHSLFRDFNQNVLCILPSWFDIMLANIIIDFITLTGLHQCRNCDAVNGVWGCRGIVTLCYVL